MQLDFLNGAVDSGLEEKLPVPEPQSTDAPTAAFEDFAVNSGLGFGRQIAGRGITVHSAKASPEQVENS